jgi:hypothetical protein
MIRVTSPIPEPLRFNEDCREKGSAWLATQPGWPDRPRDFWSPFRADLRRGFHLRCGYYAMWIHDGQVDHFVSWATCKMTNQVDLAYEWTNMRFCDGALNSRKKTLDGQVLDPFEVEDDWFEVELPTLILRPVNVPAERLASAKLTLERLELDTGSRSLELRWEWYEEHRSGRLDLDGLQLHAPLVAAAVERWMASANGPLPVIPHPTGDIYAALQ